HFLAGVIKHVHGSQGRGGDSLGADCSITLPSLESLPEFGNARRMDSGGTELIQLGLVLLNVLIDFALVVQIEHNHLVDQSKLQRGKLALEHLGRIALVVIEDEVVEPNPVPYETNFTIRVPVQTGGEEPDQLFVAAHLTRPPRAKLPPRSAPSQTPA